MSSTNGWRWRGLDLRRGLGVDVTAITLATLLAYVGIPSILGGDLMDINILQTRYLTIRCHIKQKKYSVCNKYYRKALHHITNLLINTRALSHLPKRCIVLSKRVWMAPLAKWRGSTRCITPWSDNRVTHCKISLTCYEVTTGSSASVNGRT